MAFFELRGKISQTQAIALGILGFVIFLAAWWLLAEAFAVESSAAAETTDTELTEEGAPPSSAGMALADSNAAPNLVPENAPAGAQVPMQAQWAGQDSAFYQLSDNPGGAFRIQPVTGEIFVADPAALDYEKATSLTVVVEAKNADGQVASGNFVIQLKDQNEQPVGRLSDVDPAVNQVGKNAAAGDPTGLTVFAEDPDGTAQVQYALVSNPSDIFQIDPASGAVSIGKAEALAGNSARNFNLEVEARSSDGSAARAVFTLEVVESAAGSEKAGEGKSGGEKVYPILPTPAMVVQSYPSLIGEDELLPNTLQSVWLNVQGYFWAVVISLPIGLIIGLFPMFRGLFSKQVDALRYLPLTALTGLFIIWFGIEDQMKIAFLAFGIIVYLLPVVVQRIDEVDDVYVKTAFTLGASKWQTVRSVFLPSVMSKLMDDIRVLTAISWTYIIIAELLNRQGGIGALIYLKARQGQIAKVFATLIVIILIGFLQDRIFVYLDRRLFPHKHYKTTLPGIREVEYGILTILGVMTLAIFQAIFFPGWAGWFGNLAWILVLAALVIVVYGEFKVQGALRKTS